MEGNPHLQRRAEPEPDPKILQALELFRRRESGRPLGQKASAVYRALYHHARYQLSAELTITAALVASLLDKPQSSRSQKHAAADFVRDAVTTLEGEGLLLVTSRRGGEWKALLCDPSAVLRHRGLDVVRPDAVDPQAQLDFMRAPPDEPPDEPPDLVRFPAAGEKTDQKTALETDQKTHHQDPPRNNKHLDPGSSRSAATGDSRARFQPGEDLDPAGSPREKSGLFSHHAGNVRMFGPVRGPVALAELVQGPGSILETLADPEAAAARRRRLVHQVEHYLTARVAHLFDSPARRWGEAIVDGRIPRSTVEQILARMVDLRRAEKLPRTKEVAYFITASRTAFREVGLDWPQPPKRSRPKC